MPSRFSRFAGLFLAVIFVVSLCSIDADAQRRRRRRTPRPVVTNPDIATPGSEQDPGSNGERIISTADETTATEQGETTTTRKGKTSGKTATGDDNMQETIKNLSDHVNKLNEKLSQMQENDRSLIDLERLTRAEQRAENLRMQQLDVESKMADLGSRLEQAEYSLKPENIERAAAGYGSTRPEETREARRRALENERARLQAQIKILETSKSRLEQSVVTADAEVELLRRRLDQQRQQDATGSAQTTPTPSSPARPE